MNSRKPLFPGDSSAEISALVTTLHETQQRLEVLTGGEIDTVADRDGRAFLLLRAQEQLRHSEALNQAAIMNALPANIAMLDARGVIVSVNEAWRLFGEANEIQSPGHGIGLNYLDICESAKGDEHRDAEAVAAGIRSVLDGGLKEFSFEYACHSPAEKRWFQMTATPLGDDIARGAVVMHVNITERRRREEEARRFGSAMDATADAIYLVDRASMRFIHVNYAACRMQGKTREAIMELGPEGVLSVALDELARTYDSVIASGVESAPLELPRRRADGSEVWVEIRRQAQFSDNRWTIVTLARDVTERRRAQQTFLREKNFTTAMLDSLPGLFYLIDEQGRFVRWNREFERISGYSSDEIGRLDPTDLFAGSDKKRIAEAIGQVFLTGEAMVEAEYVAKDQTRTPHLFTGRRVEFDQKPHLIGMGIDITERKRAAQLLLESEARFRSLSLLSSDWFWEQDENHRFVRFSGGEGVKGWGPDQSQAVGLHRWDLGGVIPVSSSWEEHKRQLDAHESFRNFEYRRILADGRLQFVTASGEPLHDAAGRFTGYRGVATEITQRKLAEARIVRLNRVHALLSGINSAIVRNRRRDELFAEVCRIAVANGGFHAARVVELDPDGKARLAASTEPDSPLFQKILDEYNGNPDGSRSLLALALRSEQPLVSNDVSKDTRMPNRAALTKDGTYALALLPVIVDQRIIGTVILRAGETGMFDDTELLLLREVVSNLSFALEHIEKEAKVRRLTRVYAVLSGINTLIVRVRDRAELLRETCRIAIEAGAFKMAWIGVVDQTTLDGNVVAWAGGEESFLDLIKLTAREGTPYSDRPGSRALRLMEPVICNDIATDPSVRPLRDQLLARGHRSAACFPLSVAGRREGVLCLFSGEINTFDDQETRLLVGLAGDISLALEHIEKAQKLERMTRMNAILSGINGAIVRIRDRQALLQEACRIAIEIGGMTFAWMGLANTSGKRLKLVASAGRDGGFLQSIRDRLALRNAAPEAEGLSTRVFREGRVVVVNDVAADPVLSRRKAYADRGSNAVAVFPLFIAGRVAGTFALHSEQAGFFDDDEVRLLNEVASNIAFALEHIEKEAKVRRLTRVYAVLSGINSLIVRTRDRDELYREACRIAVDTGQFSKAWIGTVDPVSKQFRMLAAHGGDPLFFRTLEKELDAKVQEGRGLAMRVIETGLPVIVNDVASDPDVLLKDDVTAAGVQSLAMLPLAVADEVVAVFALNADVVDYFDGEEMKLLVELAGDIGFAMDHIGKEARLDYLAFYDALTGLANRTLFLERVTQHMRSAVAGGHKLALFVLDLERFSNINDSLGRPAGDALLKQVTTWLVRNAGDKNLLARLGGDHFGIVLPEVAQDGGLAELLDKQIRAFADHRFRFNDAEVRIATKVGVAVFPDDGMDAETLLRNAETALKKAKAGGEHSLFYQQKMTDQLAGKLSLESQLRQALDKDEFVLHYQPKVSLESGRLTGAEALIRWNNPRTGLVPPGRFIPMLEETGLIYDVGRWALRRAVEDYLRWRAAGLRAVRIAVNVSPLQMRNNGFVSEIGQVVGGDPLAASALELEITENLIMQDVDHSIASLRAIRAMGVPIAIDDFGTGFSSLSYLAKLPVDTLKIDRSFVTDMTTGADGLALVSTIISLAHSLRLKVVAEGVETEEQARLLRLLRCEEMQGFLFSKPLPGDVFREKYLPSLPLELDLQAATP